MNLANGPISFNLATWWKIVRILTIANDRIVDSWQEAETIVSIETTETFDRSSGCAGVAGGIHPKPIKIDANTAEWFNLMEAQIARKMNSDSQ